MAHREWDLDCKVYIGGLSEDANKYGVIEQGTAYNYYFKSDLTWKMLSPVTGE